MKRTRALATMTVAAVLALSAVACGSRTPHHAARRSAGQAHGHSALAFSRCMRSHGVTHFPDPQTTERAKFPGAQQLGVSAPRYATAQKDCQQLLPPGIDDIFPRAEVRVLLAGMLSFSRCMRSHGVPRWPDPTIGPQGRPVYNLVPVPSVDANSPQATRAEHRCGHLEPSAMGGIPLREG